MNFHLFQENSFIQLDDFFTYLEENSFIQLDDFSLI
jgi:hypothetical protein